MASYRLMNRVTGIILSGYCVLSATEAEIAQANQRLSQSGSTFRFVAQQAQKPEQSA